MTKIRKKIGTIPINDIEQQVQQSTQDAVTQMQHDVTDFINEETAQYPEIGGAFKFQEDPEGRSEVTTDAEDKIISYRDSDGMKHEEVGIKTDNANINHLNLTDTGMTEFQKALKDAGFQPGGAGDYTDYLSNDGVVPLAIAEPRCAYINISGIDAMPVTKTANLQAYMEMYDYNGNYFKKKVIINAQGNSSLVNPQKNFAVDMFDSEWDGDAFSLKVGNWVPQDSFHFKCFHYDPTKGLATILFKYAEEVIKATDTRPNRNARKADETTSINDSGDFTFDFDNNALCHPDGIPAVVYLNGEFYGLFSWNLKKHRDNYMMNKKDYEAIHIDSDTANLWSNDPIDWTLFEVRNPKTLICMDGSKYDGDNPQELIDSTSPNYDSSNKDHKNTVKTKTLIDTLHTVVPAINAASTTSEKKELFEQYFDKDSFIVFFLLSQIMDNYDGLWGRNTQWLYYKNAGKWCPSFYDLDSCLGYQADHPWLEPPRQSILGNNLALPYGLLWSLYQDEVKAKYAELKQSGLFSVNAIMKYVYDWCDRFGDFNLKRSIEKWETPCYRDGKVNSEYWEQIGCTIHEQTYDENTQYNPGDEVYFGWTYSNSGYIMQYRCKKACIGEIPSGAYDVNPMHGGCFDSPRRVKKWLEEKFVILDGIMIND